MTKLLVAFRNFAKAPKIFNVITTCQNISKSVGKLQPFVIRIKFVYYQRPEFNVFILKYVHGTQEINKI